MAIVSSADESHKLLILARLPVMGQGRTYGEDRRPEYRIQPRYRVSLRDHVLVEWSYFFS